MASVGVWFGGSVVVVCLGCFLKGGLGVGPRGGDFAGGGGGRFEVG